MVIPRCNCSRLASKKWRRDDVVNIYTKLQIREIGPKRNRGVNLKYDPQRFRNFKPQVEYDTAGTMSLITSQVYLISSARGILFVLLRNGKCYAYRQGKYAKYIRRGRPDLGFPILRSEQLKWPGHIEFDDAKQKIITSSIEENIYYKVKVFDLNNYAMLYCILEKHMLNFRTGPGIILLRFANTRGSLRLKILSVEDGVQLKSFKIPLDCDKEPKFVELFHEKILLKQKKKNLQILDVCSSELTEINHTEHMSPPRIFFLDRNQLFLTIKNHILVSWDLHGGDLAVTSFGDRHLWGSGSVFDQFYITRDQHLIISYCRPDISSRQWLEEGQAFSISIVDILTGKCIVKINAKEDSKSDCGESKQNQASGISNTIADALKVITALYYDEEFNHIYTANKDGVVHEWCN